MNLTPVCVNKKLSRMFARSVMCILFASSSFNIFAAVPAPEPLYNFDVESKTPLVSDDGRYVAFKSFSSNIVPNDTNNTSDLFLHDRQTGTTVLMSSTKDGVQPNGRVDDIAMSGDARYFTFKTSANNLSPNDTNNKADVFVKDRITGELKLVSLTNAGESMPTSSGSITRGAMSGDGRFIIIYSWAKSAESEQNCATFNEMAFTLRDLQTNTNEYVCEPPGGFRSSANILSYDGNHVVFEVVFRSNNPWHTVRSIYMYHRIEKTIEKLFDHNDNLKAALDNGWVTPNLAISQNNQIIAFITTGALLPDDTNDREDLYIYDRATKKFERILSNNGQQVPRISYGNDTRPHISADGQYVTFNSIHNLITDTASSSPDIFLYDRTSKQSELITKDETNSRYPVITPDGRYIAFSSNTVYIYDLLGGNTAPVANAGSSLDGNDKLQLDGSLSYDPDNDVMDYTWLISGEATPRLGQTVLIDDLVVGTYTVTLNVSDGVYDATDTMLLGVAATGTSDPQKLQVLVTSIGDVIAIMDTAVLKKSNQQTSLTNKIDVVLDLIALGDYQLALDKLQNDIKGKTDGCANGGAPDNNDWITDCAVQDVLYTGIAPPDEDPDMGKVSGIIDKAVYYLQKVLAQI